jgi:hypothetical protein
LESDVGRRVPELKENPHSYLGAHAKYKKVKSLERKKKQREREKEK